MATKPTQQSIRHCGIVDSIGITSITVRILSKGACAGCEARMACGNSESREKIIEVVGAEPSRYKIGDEVEVCLNRGAAYRAVVIAYVLSLVVLLASLIFTLTVLHLNEGLSALVALGATALYFCGVWAIRKRLEKQTKFTITT